MIDGPQLETLVVCISQWISDAGIREGIEARTEECVLWRVLRILEDAASETLAAHAPGPEDRIH